jgi:hypothetical protein
VPLLIIDDLGMRKPPHTATEDLMGLIMRHYERASTLLTSNPTRRRFWRAALRHGRIHRVSGSASAGGARAEMWSAPLAHKAL